MKKRLRERLPYGVRKLARRAVVRMVSATAPLLKDVLNIAATNGMDLRQALGAKVQTNFATNGASECDVHDFLLLMDLLADRRTSAADSNRHIRSSIIILAHNQVSHTFNCLRSLIQHVNPGESEIIFINNASSDETRRLLSYLKDFVRVIDNPENLGFGKACNQGAAIASGQYLVFLNNDTVVQPEWLTNLINTVESDAAVGAVGSMLLYPDGRLQEAGGIVWRDGKASHYGWGENPEDQKFNLTREVDYCSAAALLVRKDLFSRLGGFDERYTWAYYEDIDLCFGIRSLGFKVVYQPLARAVHYEGATAGTDLQSGFKHYQMTNQDKFAEKWRGELLNECWEYRPELVEAAARRHGGGARIVVFDSILPEPDKDAGSARMFLILKSLAKIGKTIFVPVFGPPGGPYASLLAKEGIEVGSRMDLKRLIGGSECEIAILSRVAVADEMLASIRRENKNIKVIFDTVDIYSMRLKSEYQITGNRDAAEEAELRRRQERNLARLSDQVWCVTEYDKQVLKKEAPRGDVKIIPTIHELHDRGASFSERAGLLFIGSFLHRPNLDALDYFVKTIAPLLSESLPEVKLYVVGSYMTDRIKAYSSDSVVVLGHLPEVDSLFHRSRLFIAPLRYGSGMKGKIGQAMSYGLPVVTTSIGAEGFQLSDGHDVMIADGPAAFAEAIVKAYADRELWQRLSENCYQHVREHLTPEIVNEEIVAAINELCPRQV